MCNEYSSLKFLLISHHIHVNFFILVDFVMSSVSLYDTHLRLIVGNDCLNALDR